MTVRTLRVISWRELSGMIPFTRQHVLRLEKAGKFPRRIQIGARRVGWLYTEIESWVTAKVEGRDQKVSAEEVHDGLR
jgi:prophage regulatory protein